MRGMKILVGLLASATAFASVPANAAPITYTVSGSFSGTLNDSPVTDFDATFIGLGDTDDAFLIQSFVTAVPLSSLTFEFDGEIFTLLGQNLFAVNRMGPAGGFSDGTLNGDKVAFFSDSFVNYDGISNISGVTGPNANPPFDPYTFLTDKGSFDILTVTDISFSASVAAVPEPATWAMMLVGFGMVGAATRYRRKRTTVAYA